MLFYSLYAFATILLVFDTIMFTHDWRFSTSGKKKKTLNESLLKRSVFLAFFLLWPFYLYGHMPFDQLIYGLAGLLTYYVLFTMILERSVKSGILNILKTLLFTALGAFALYLYFSVLSPWLLSGLMMGFFIVVLVVFDRLHPRILTRLFRVVPYVHNSDYAFLKDMNFNREVHMIEIEGFKAMKNAMIVGLFKPLRLYVSKGMLETMKHNEVMGVIAHEVGHVKKGHLRIRMILGFLSLLSVFSIGILIFTFESRPLFDYSTFVLAMIILGMLYRSLFAILLQYQEFDADAYALQVGQAENLVEALNKLKRGEPKVHNRLFHRLRASHPPTQRRIDALMNAIKK